MKTYPAVLHLMCGKAGAGKSTLAQRLAQQPQTLLLVEDAWLATLYEQEMASLQDYARCSERLRRALGGHLVQLLRGGWSVALDFPMNTPDRRRWSQSVGGGGRRRALPAFSRRQPCAVPEPDNAEKRARRVPVYTERSGV